MAHLHVRHFTVTSDSAGDAVMTTARISRFRWMTVWHHRLTTQLLRAAMQLVQVSR